MTEQPEQDVEPRRPRKRYIRIVVIVVILAGPDPSPLSGPPFYGVKLSS
jgi:hypothetical protein